jgi:hypothetical protein
MRKKTFLLGSFAAALLAAGVLLEAKSAPKLSLDAPSALTMVNGAAQVLTYKGRRAVRLAPPAGQEKNDGSIFAIVNGSEFKDGTIEVDVAGAPRPGSAPNMKGFIGVAFRVQGNAEGAEMFYIRPLNARDSDQLVRNHSVQYVSDPDFSWQRLRTENPGVYESYADLEPAAWTHLKIVVAGAKAWLYVNGAAQPCLVVNDLKRGDSHGQIALWSHTTTEAYFANLQVK